MDSAVHNVGRSQWMAELSFLGSSRLDEKVGLSGRLVIMGVVDHSLHKILRSPDSGVGNSGIFELP